MNFYFQRSYRGPLRGVILDWAGTVVDYGCFAPTAVVLKVFASRGVSITVEQARGPMGLMKKDHLRAVAQMEPVARRWQEVHGQSWTEADIEAMFQEFVPTQLACIRDYADLIPGTLGAMAEFRRRGLKIGSTTGYVREMMEVLVPEAQRRGYTPDAWVCPSDVPAGRPWPWMAYLNAMRLQVYPLEAFVKIGDTLPDIEEGLNAGMWTVGLTLSGNELGLSEAEAAALDEPTRQAKRAAITAKMRRAGAHYVVDDIGHCAPLLDEITARLARGERP